TENQNSEKLNQLSTTYSEKTFSDNKRVPNGYSLIPRKKIIDSQGKSKNIYQVSLPATKATELRKKLIAEGKEKLKNEDPESFAKYQKNPNQNFDNFILNKYYLGKYFEFTDYDNKNKQNQTYLARVEAHGKIWTKKGLINKSTIGISTFIKN